jgi:hypothetical protein
MCVMSLKNSDGLMIIAPHTILKNENGKKRKTFYGFLVFSMVWDVRLSLTAETYEKLKSLKCH